MVPKPHLSRRVTIKQWHSVHKKIKSQERKRRRERKQEKKAARAAGRARRRPLEEIPIPNSCPFKKDILKRALAMKEAEEAARLAKAAQGTDGADDAEFVDSREEGGNGEAGDSA